MAWNIATGSTFHHYLASSLPNFVRARPTKKLPSIKPLSASRPHSLFEKTKSSAPRLGTLFQESTGSTVFWPRLSMCPPAPRPSSDHGSSITQENKKAMGSRSREIDGRRDSWRFLGEQTQRLLSLFQEKRCRTAGREVRQSPIKLSIIFSEVTYLSLCRRGVKALVPLRLGTSSSQSCNNCCWSKCLPESCLFKMKNGG